MLRNYLKVAWKVLLRRKFFTFISLFGISFTLLVLMVTTSVLDHVFAPHEVEPHADGMNVTGGPIGAGEVASLGDHRIAMAFAVAGTRAGGPVRITDCANVATSFPEFPALARAAGMRIRVEAHGP